MSRVSCQPRWCTGSSVKMVICAIVEAIVHCGNRSDRPKDRGIKFYRLPTIITHQGVQTRELSQERQLA